MGIYGGISGSDMDFSNQYQNTIRQASFSSKMIDASLQLEFNFLPFLNTTKFKYNHSFYVTAGLGYTHFLGGAPGTTHNITIPMGIGYKYNLFKKLTLGAEWTYHKTYQDEIDGVINLNNELYYSSVHNFDWHSFAIIFVAYKLFYQEGDCPAYWDK